MGARQATCFIAVCDDCETEYEDDYTPHWLSDREAIDDAVCRGDWWSDDEKALLCPDCTFKPHAFVEGMFDASGCLRCGNPLDEHPVVTDA